MQTLLSTAAAAARLGVTPSRVRQYVIAGLLTPVALGGRDHFFTADSIDSFVKPLRGNPNLLSGNGLHGAKKSSRKSRKMPK